jgi:hypothetical protein
MPKCRVGLQKEFSEIFDGVWIPKRTRPKKPPTAPEQKKQQEWQIKQIIAAMKCAKDFQCYKSGLTNLCKAKLVADTGLVECLPENQQACEFRASFMDRTFCKCQLRCYIAKNLHK